MFLEGSLCWNNTWRDETTLTRRRPARWLDSPALKGYSAQGIIPASVRYETHLLFRLGLTALHGVRNDDASVRIIPMNDRRSWSQDVLSFGPFDLFGSERLLKKADEPVQLGSRALDILIALVERAGEVVTHKELIKRVWQGVNVEETNLRVHVSALRKAIGDGQDGARYISSVAGRGYCFVAPIKHPPIEQRASPFGIVDAERFKKLPSPLSRMVGREGIVQTLSAELMLRRFVSIVGPGGIGKTTVAVSVAHKLLTGFEGGIFFVDLSVLTNPKLVPTAVASTLGFMSQPQDPIGSILAFLSEKKVLLILDNCEHVIDTAAALAERVVSEAPQVHVLATSRETLRVRGEHVHLLHSLEGPPDDGSLTAAEALAYPAAQLFMERATASGHIPDLTDLDARIVARICRKLDGIALAIELVASHVGALGIRGTAELLDSRFGLLWQGRRTALPRHETLNAMLDWSYNLLSERDKLVLCCLSVFVGDFPLLAAYSVASPEGHDLNVAGAIVSLVEKSLISTSEIGQGTYYRLVDLTRAFAKAKLAQRSDGDNIARRHAIFYSRFLQDEEILRSRFGKYDLSEFSPHIGNVRASLDWALSDHGDVTIGIELAVSAAPLFIGLSLLDECRRWCERALAVLDYTGRNSRLEMVLQEALALSSMYTSGHNELIRAALDRALMLAQSLGDRLHWLQLLAGLNLFLNRIGDVRGARMAAEQGAVLARETSDPAGVIWAEWMLGISHCLEGNQGEAQFHCERGLALAANIVGFNANYFGCDHRVRALIALARALWLRGFSDQAIRTMQSALDEAASQYDPVSMSVALIYAASVSLWAGDLQRARSLIEQLIPCAGRYSLDPFHATGLALKGQLAIALGDAESGIALLRNALKILREKSNIVVPTFTGALAEGLRKTGKLDEALFTIDEAITLAINSGVKIELSELLRIKSLVFVAQNDRESAINCLIEAIEVARMQSALAFELRAAIDLAGLLSDGEQRDQGRHRLALVYERFSEGFQTADLAIARRLLENLQP
jgi:predicted ATPase/DNA-binding winged helix-turn-helix (wHTH) protein